MAQNQVINAAEHAIDNCKKHLVHQKEQVASLGHYRGTTLHVWAAQDTASDKGSVSMCLQTSIPEG
jgi:hypothetical protein